MRLILEVLRYILSILQSVDIPEDQAICVRTGDVIGIQYPNKDEQGIISYEQSGYTSTAGVSQDQLSKLFNEDIGDGSLPVGTTKTVVIEDFKRLPALKPILA